MRKAGCKQISIGVESLNNSKLIGTKNFSEMEIAKAIYNIQNAGILSKCCIMLGMQGQTKEDIITTFDFLSARNAIIRPTIYTPYQVIDGNTKINELCKYNRKTYDKSNIPGIEYEQLLQLVKSPSKYRKILNIDKEKETEFER